MVVRIRASLVVIWKPGEMQVLRLLLVNLQLPDHLNGENFGDVGDAADLKQVKKKFQMVVRQSFNG